MLQSYSYLTFGVFCRTPLNIAIRVKRVIITIDILPGMAVGSTAIESQAIITNKLCLNQKRLLKSIHNGIEFRGTIMIIWPILVGSFITWKEYRFESSDSWSFVLGSFEVWVQENCARSNLSDSCLETLWQGQIDPTWCLD